MFIYAEQTVVIHRPLAEVFALVSDATKESLWNPAVLRTEQLDSKPVGIGTVYQETHRVILRQNTMTSEVVSYQPNQHIGFKSISGGPVQTHMYTLEPQAEGTRITLRSEVQIPGFFGILAPFLRRIAHEQTIKSLAQLKQFLEHE